ncbi:tail assembly chaperone [Corynebacterium phage EmiRose]|nr:tail assembly chaperone [Corynebacterium phage EmiRose]QGJ94145.1 tail assembly chaperone [Corynebacterium phage EmiRose]
MSAPAPKKTTKAKAKAKAPKAVKDKAPALADVHPAFDTEAPEGVDIASMPAFRNLNSLLPAQRFEAQTSLAKVAGNIPGVDVANPEAAQEVADQFSRESITFEDLEVMAEAMTVAQEVVLDNAEDTDAMSAWLVSHEGMTGISALFYAYSKLASQLGK